MTSITQASPRYVHELTTILGPQNRTQGSCEQSRHVIFISPDFPGDIIVFKRIFLSNFGKTLSIYFVLFHMYPRILSSSL